MYPSFSPRFRRRTLKNRGYAASCRIKRLEQKGDLEHEKGQEYENLDSVQVRKRDLAPFRDFENEFFPVSQNEFADFFFSLACFSRELCALPCTLRYGGECGLARKENNRAGKKLVKIPIRYYDFKFFRSLSFVSMSPV